MGIDGALIPRTTVAGRCVANIFWVEVDGLYSWDKGRMDEYVIYPCRLFGVRSSARRILVLSSPRGGSCTNFNPTCRSEEMCQENDLVRVCVKVN